MSSATNDDRRIDGFSHGEIQRAATELIASHGDKAAMVAAMKVQSFITKGNLDGERLWLRILAAVKMMKDARATDCLHGAGPGNEPATGDAPPA